MYHYVFVYGTLKRGFHNHNRFLQGMEPVAIGYIRGKLLQGGLPYLVEGDGQVHGEVYEISSDLRNTLDALEGHPKWYRRMPVDVTPDKGRTLRAEAYFYQMPPHSTMYRHIEDGVYRG